MKTLSIFLLLLIAMKTNAQIPNNSFEDWGTVGNCIEPLNWFSCYSLIDSTGNYSPVTRSTDHFPNDAGNYSVRITNDTSIWNNGISPFYFLGWGMLTTSKLNDRPLFPVTGHPSSLSGYYKFLPENGDTMNISIHLYINGVEITSGQLKSDIMATEWTLFRIYFADTSYLSIDSARILLSASNEPKDGSKGPLGNSVLYIDNLTFDLPTAIFSTNDTYNPGKFELNQNYPNPFNPNTKITYQLRMSSDVTLKVFDVLGNELTTLVDEYKPAGKYEVEWIAGEFPSGVYFYQLKAVDPLTGSGQVYVNTKKTILLK